MGAENPLPIQTDFSPSAHDTFHPATHDQSPLTLHTFHDAPEYIDITGQTDQKEAIAKLTEFYEHGVNEYAHSQNIFIDLPDKELRPSTYYNAYEWLEEAWCTLHGTSSLVFDELISNAATHGKGFRGATAAWINPTTFMLLVADHGQGFGSSNLHFDGIGSLFINHFATEPMETVTRQEGHILTLCRNLDRIELPEQKALFDIDISKEIQFIQNRWKDHKKLPQYHPDSATSGGFNPNIGPYGAMITYNRLGDVIRVTQLTEEPDGWM